MFPGYVLIHMIMNDDTWYVVRNTRGVTGFVGPGSKPVPLTEAEMKPLGIKVDNITIDFGEGDTIVVVAGAWKNTVGVVQRIDFNKQEVTINVDMFGRDTPVEISFAEVRKFSWRRNGRKKAARMRGYMYGTMDRHMPYMQKHMPGMCYKYGWDSGSHKTTLTTIYYRRCHYGKESSRIY